MQTRPVTIQNIVAINDKGEFGYTNVASPADSLTRLIKYIQLLADYALAKHKAGMSEDSELITRLVLNEFSLYTQDKPFSLRDYKQLIGEVARIASTLPPNIHLVLATLPVVWEDGKLRNVGLHVQSPRKPGSKPNLHHIEKRKPDDSVDLNYKNSLWNYPLYAVDRSIISFHKRKGKKDLSAATILADTPITKKKQSGGAIKVKTANGASFLEAMEICVEHDCGAGIYDTKNLIRILKVSKQTVPDDACHILSSDTIERKKQFLIGSLVHADRTFYKKTFLTQETLAAPFGGAVTFYVYPQKPLKPLKEKNLQQSTYMSEIMAMIANDDMPMERVRGSSDEEGEEYSYSTESDSSEAESESEFPRKSFSDSSSAARIVDVRELDDGDVVVPAETWSMLKISHSGHGVFTTKGVVSVKNDAPIADVEMDRDHHGERVSAGINSDPY